MFILNKLFDVNKFPSVVAVSDDLDALKREAGCGGLIPIEWVDYSVSGDVRIIGLVSCAKPSELGLFSITGVKVVGVDGFKSLVRELVDEVGDMYHGNSVGVLVESIRKRLG